MKVEVNVTESFRRAAKPLIKRYRSFLDDLEKLERTLLEKPESGTPLGRSVYKVRLKVASKSKGKSGGARVITFLKYVEPESHDGVTVVNLITAYDKSERETITDSELRRLIADLDEELG